MIFRKVDALDHDIVSFELADLQEQSELHRVYGVAGFDNNTRVDSALRNPCMLSAGFAMLAESDDTYGEVCCN